MSTKEFIVRNGLIVGTSNTLVANVITGNVNITGNASISTNLSVNSVDFATAIASGNSWANFVGTSANSYAASLAQQGDLTPAYAFANTKLSNTSGVSFAGDLNFPTGKVTVGNGGVSNGQMVKIQNNWVGNLRFTMDTASITDGVAGFVSRSTYNHTTDSVGHLADVIINPISLSNNQTVVGLSVIPENRSPFYTSHLIGMEIAPTHNNGGTANWNYGIWSWPIHNTTNNAGIYHSGEFDGVGLTSSGNTAYSIGVYVTPPWYDPADVIGRVTNTTWGLRIDNHDTDTTSGVAYNFYSYGATAKNIFEGNVGIGTNIPSQKLYVKGNMIANGHAAIGKVASIDKCTAALGINEWSPYAATLMIQDEYIGDLSVWNGLTDISVFDTFTHTGANGAASYGLDIEPLITSSSTGPWGEVSGLYVLPQIYGSGSAGTFWGSRIGAKAATSNTVDSLYCLEVIPSLASSGGLTLGVGIEVMGVRPESTGTVNTNYGIRLNSPTSIGAGTSNTNYGMYIANQTPASANSWNFYSAGDISRNYFAGSVGIGNNNPTEALTVDGNSIIKGRASFGSNAKVPHVSWGYQTNSISLSIDDTHSGDLSLTNTGVQGSFAVSSTYSGNSAPGYAVINDTWILSTIAQSNERVIDWFEGLYSNPTNYSNVTVNSITGLDAAPSHYGNGSVGIIYGVLSEPGVESPSTTSTIAGFSTKAYLYAGSNVTSHYGVFVNLPAFYGGSKITGSSYGVYINDQTSASVTGTAYNFYSSGATAKNIFEGNVGIGTNIPSEKLHLKGNMIANGKISVGSNGWPVSSNTASIEVRNTWEGNLTPSFVGGYPASIASYSQYSHTGQISAYIYDIYCRPELITTNTSAAISEYYGIYAPTVLSGNGNITWYGSIETGSEYYGTGSLDVMTGITNYTWQASTTDVDNVYDIISSFYISDVGNIKEHMGLLINIPHAFSSGTVTGNNYGIYIDNQESAAVTGNTYNFYSKGDTAKNIFEGKVKIGNGPDVITSNSATLTVNKTWTGDLRFADTPKTWWGPPAVNGLVFDSTYDHNNTNAIEISELYINPVNKANVTYFRGMWVSPENQSSVTSIMYGIECIPHHKGTANLDYISGYYTQPWIDSDFNITYNDSISDYGPTFYANGNITTSKTLAVGSPSVASASYTGRITGTNYGIYIEDHDVSAVTGTSYNFYSVGATAKNIFEGNVGIGTNIPNQKLHLKGNAIANGKMTIGSNNLPIVESSAALTVEHAWSGNLNLGISTTGWNNGVSSFLLRNSYNHTGNQSDLGDIIDSYITPVNAVTSNSRVMQAMWIGPENWSTKSNYGVWGLEVCPKQMPGSGDSSSFLGLYVWPLHMSSSTITQSMSMEVDGPYFASSGNVITSYTLNLTEPLKDVGAAGRVTGTTYGLYISNHDTATSTGVVYNFYSAGSATKNIFEGNVGIGTTLPTQKLHLKGNLLANGRASFGSEAQIKSFDRYTIEVNDKLTGNLHYDAIGSVGSIHVTNEYTHTSDLDGTSIYDTWLNPVISANNTKDTYWSSGLYLYFQHMGTGNVTSNLVGTESQPSHEGTGTVNKLYAVVGTPTLANTGNVAYAAAFYNTTSLSGQGNITVANYGLFIDQPYRPGTGRITGTNYGVYIADQVTAATAGTPYNFYSAGTNANNVIMGRLGIGTTAPGATYKLDVAGTINAASVLINTVPVLTSLIPAYDWANTVGTAGNSVTSLVATSANAYAALVGTTGNNITSTVAISANTWANTIGASANGWANTVSSSANTYMLATTKNMLQNNVTTQINVGYTVASFNAGANLAAFGTWTPDPANGNYQYANTNGALTIAVPASNCAIDALIWNGPATGSITFSGYTAPSGGGGDTYATTAGNRYLLSIRRINAISTYAWKALQ